MCRLWLDCELHCWTRWNTIVISGIGAHSVASYTCAGRRSWALGNLCVVKRWTVDPARRFTKIIIENCERPNLSVIASARIWFSRTHVWEDTARVWWTLTTEGSIVPRKAVNAAAPIASLVGAIRIWDAAVDNTLRADPLIVKIASAGVRVSVVNTIGVIDFTAVELAQSRDRIVGVRSVAIAFIYSFWPSFSRTVWYA